MYQLFQKSLMNSIFPTDKKIYKMSSVNSISSHLYSFSKKVKFAEQFSWFIGSSYKDFFRLSLGGFCCSEGAPGGLFFPFWTLVWEVGHLFMFGYLICDVLLALSFQA